MVQERANVDVDVDAVCSVLASADRRRLLSYLSNDAEVTTTTELARTLADERDVPPERIETELNHVDLPALAAIHAIEYHREIGVVEPTPLVEDLLACASSIEEIAETSTRGTNR